MIEHVAADLRSCEKARNASLAVTVRMNVPATIKILLRYTYCTLREHSTNADKDRAVERDPFGELLRNRTYHHLVQMPNIRHTDSDDSARALDGDRPSHVTESVEKDTQHFIILWVETTSHVASDKGKDVRRAKVGETDIWKSPTTKSAPTF
ncbi:uncharacterized protein BT62DRAFT_1004618 [Guyanagaster necrorhizus]|uniref:Uncharacterized protein n=1 Tax=Guyanagaster necrorhizus TaxID=856835 RepID=A0A9P7VVS5_9AGAR|nr:uncharacterized protein BT62DRAFT_1004618 [Guyanagaster necrorhizus MCA 3950]KAG7447849.1 hypothetical protein BT62DRAFT_1004618 [Guyanagaster necrorhizus MCA 3950]